MFDITTETPIRLHEAARVAGEGRGERPTHESTVLRWILAGVRGPGGHKVRLEGMRIGTHWVTSREALTPRLGDTPVPAYRTAARRQRAAWRAGEQLKKIGI